ncbi:MULTISPECIES: glycosyltransferase family 4 protein [Halomonas]|uniref:glycosyltransferase family 4 protein n=1 Tax=Halomonas TaxID=2745 RepID=UPI001C962D37|nr:MULTISPECIES: glycosyltransferase family 4 protein [Halomonas]MBY6208226.1 glycosyltransferase family 4 protein [Halomonas sp. DP3Y7-2]MBY6229035.1 glycosyltransferase family 4 protein [Halomonas sp. DP3Y7-1]MCA0916982.1 glycosyltransferase family 4 protein [Halomonas denitrificans]
MNCLHISNMYPSIKFPSFGTFVKETDDILSTVAHVERVVIDSKKKTTRDKIGQYFKFYVNIIKAVVRKKWDVIYIHFPSHTFIPVLISIFFIKSRVVINFHGGDAFNQPGRSTFFFKIKKIINHIAIKKSHVVVVPSEHFKELVCSKYNTPRLKVIVNYSGGVCTEKFRYVKRHDLSERKIRVVYAARMEKVKDPLQVAKCVSNNSRQLENFCFSFVGSGTLKEKVVDVLSSAENCSYSISDSVAHKEIEKLFKDNDFVIQSSISESLGLVVLEAMATGCIPICRDIPAFRNIIDDRIDGLLFSTEADLLYCFKYIQNMNSIEVREMSRKAREKVVSRYSRSRSIEIMMKSVLNIESQ